MKKILILAREPETFAKLAQSLTTDAAEVEVAAYSDLAFWIDDDEAKVFCYKTSKDLREYQRILVLSTSPYHKQKSSMHETLPETHDQIHKYYNPPIVQAHP